MKKIILAAVMLIATGSISIAQNIGIGTTTPNAAALLDVTATNKGVLVPRVTNAQMLAIASPANGLLVYNTDSACFAYRNATAWVFLKGNATASNDWSTKGNAGTDTSKNFIGTTDDVDLVLKRNNQRAGLINNSRSNTSFGVDALSRVSSGRFNTATGWKALTVDTSGSYNTANGTMALFSNTTGGGNTANGYQSLFFNITGVDNTATGSTALLFNNGNCNTANGVGSLASNTSGFSNVAMGKDALFKNTNSSNLVAIGDSALFNNGNGATQIWEAKANTATGSKALYSNTTGYGNVANGYNALYSNTTGRYNVAVGKDALLFNTTGQQNSVYGYEALASNTTGSGNVAIGIDVLYNNYTGNDNTAIGNFSLQSLQSGSNNVAIGLYAGADILGSGNVFIGANAGRYDQGSNKLYISNSESDLNNTLIYGEFDNKLLRSNGRMEVNSDNTLNNGLRVIKNYAAGNNKNTSAVYGENAVDDSWGIGLEGKGGLTGVQGTVSGSGIVAGYTGVKGISNGTNGAFNYGVQGQASGSSFKNIGMYGIATGTGSNNYGIYGEASGGSANYAGYFVGNVEVNGKLTITTNAGTTGIDLASSDAYAEMRVIRNTVNSTDKDLYFGFGSPAGSGLHLFSDALETMTIKNNLTGVGKAPAVSTDYGKLQVKQSGSFNAITMEAAGNTNHWDFFIPTVANADLLLYYNGAAKGSFSNATGAYAINSDRRLKKDISPQVDILNNVMQLKAYQYHYLDNKPTDNFSNGFMAQDVQKLFPDAVVENTMKDGETRLGINYQYFTVLAIKGLQEQQQQIQLQEERIAKLEAMVKTLVEKK